MKNNLSFSRRIGRPLSKRGQDLVETLLPHCLYPVPYTEEKHQFGLEIGFGYGEHLAASAACHPEIAWIGCEPFMNGVASLLTFIDTQNLENIRIWHDDVALLLPQLEVGLLERVNILFPDPWPKTKHYKRRLIQQEFLRKLACVCALGARLVIVTDHEDYARWIRELDWLETGFTSLPKSEEPLITVSKYHHKALTAKATIHRFDFSRNDLSIKTDDKPI